MTKAVDAWTHVFPKAYFEKLQTIASASGPLKRWMNLKSLYDLDARFRIMDAFEDYSQLLTPSMPPVEELGEEVRRTTPRSSRPSRKGSHKCS